jgi:hypothetical protein
MTTAAADVLRCTLLRLVRAGDAGAVASLLAAAPAAAAVAAVDSRTERAVETAEQLRALGAARLQGRRVCRFFLHGRSATQGAFYAGEVLGGARGGNNQKVPCGGGGQHPPLRVRVRYSDGEVGELGAEELAECIMPVRPGAQARAGDSDGASDDDAEEEEEEEETCATAAGRRCTSRARTATRPWLPRCCR